MKKIPRFAEAAWICGIVFCAFGVALTIKADFGVSMIAAPPYILHAKISEYFPSFTLGTTEYCFQGVLLLVMLAVVRRIRLKYFMCFLTAVIYGKVLDLMLFLLGGGEAYEQMPVRIVVFAAGGVITSLAIAFFFRTYLPLQIYELFVTECAAVFNKPNEKVKYIFDGGGLLISVTLTLVLFRGFEGIGVGTIILTLANAPIIAGCGKLLDKCFDFSPLSPKLEKKYK